VLAMLSLNRSHRHFGIATEWQRTDEELLAASPRPSHLQAAPGSSHGESKEESATWSWDRDRPDPWHAIGSQMMNVRSWRGSRIQVEV